MFKKILIGSIAAATMTASAYAADLPARAPAPPPPVPVCIWCGFYVGVNGGGGWLRNQTSAFVETVGVGGLIFPVSTGLITTGGNGGFFNGGNNNNNNNVGAFGGGQAGINWQFGPIVAGAELDAQGSRINQIGAGAATNVFGGLTSVTTTRRIDFFGTARGRLGIAFGGPGGWGPGFGPAGWGGSVLVYVTGGAAYVGAREGFTSVTTIGPFALTAAELGNNARVGFAGGGGIEWKFLPNWSIKGEYQYIGVREGPVAAANEFVFGIGLPFVVRHVNPPIGLHTARIGLNYHFTLAPPAPVVAKY